MKKSYKIPYKVVMKRILEVSKQKNVCALAKDLGYSPQSMHNHKKRDSLPSSTVLRFAVKYNCSIDWLLTGQGQRKRRWKKSIFA